MYQKACFLLGAALSVAVASAQPKYDCYWMMGYADYAPPDQIWGASAMDFCGDSLQIYEIDRPMEFGRANASMADAEGNLLFYTNGIYIANAQHEPMLNGTDLLTPGTTGYGEDGIPIPQGVLILPWPGNPSKYYVFYGKLTLYFIGNNASGGLTPFYYALVDMSLEGGLGAVVEKNVVITSDTLDLGKLTATRHANGRDWWVVAPKNNSHQLFRFLLTPEGLIDHGSFTIDERLWRGWGQAAFSPDGEYYAHLSIYNWGLNYITFLGFDRCTGEFSSLGQFHYPDPNEAFAGLAISPNSRFVYNTSTEEIRQFDLWADDVVGSMDTVAVYDGIEETIPGISFTLRTIFFLAQLAPDGKIYIISSNTVRSMHVIEQPDLPGVACEVRQRGIVLPKLNRTIPNFPHYRLGALEGSPCDTIVAVSAAEQRRGGDGWQLRVLPNPAQDFCVLVLDPLAGDALPALENLSLRLYDSMGRLLRRQALPAGLREHRIGLEGLPPGMYYVSVQAGGQLAKTEKLIVLR
jgi:hypothetical protein